MSVKLRDKLKYLYLDGVFSRDLTLALFNRDKILKQRTIKEGTRTERFLPAVMKFLGSRVPSGIVVAQGGGSFSQTRIVCAIANALAYGWGIKVAGVPPTLSIAQVSSKFPKLRWQRLLLPTYSASAVAWNN